MSKTLGGARDEGPKDPKVCLESQVNGRVGDDEVEASATCHVAKASAAWQAVPPIARGTSPRRLSPTSPFSCDALIWHTSDALIWPCNPSDADGGMPRPSSRLVCHVGARSGMRTLRSWPPSRMVRLPR